MSQMMITKHRFVPFSRAEAGDTTFLMEANPEIALPMIAECKASVLYLHENVARKLIPKYGMQDRPDKLCASPNPKLAFIRAIVADDELMKTNAYYYREVSPNNNIPRNCMITNANIFNCTMGFNCIVHANTSIGFPALAVERDENGDPVLFPHIGRVHIQDNVRVGSVCTISRGTLDDTVIGTRTVIDDHVHIAHNCHIGPRNLIAAGTIIGGSVITGRDCWFGLNSTIQDHVTIGNNVLVAAGACVNKDVPDHDIVAGVPAKSIKDKVTLSERSRFRMVAY